MSAVHIDSTVARPRRAARRAATAVVAAAALCLAGLAPAVASDGPDPEPAPPGTSVTTGAGTSPEAAGLAAAQSFLGMAAAAPWMPPTGYSGEIKGLMGAWGGFTNGGIPLSALCSPSWSSKKVRCDAAHALEAMNAEYRAAFGVNISLTSAYRTYAEQEALHKADPVGAAAPGTSNHGWALAIDFGGGINTYGTAQHNWMRSNANRFGWFQPAWAQYYGSLPEPWHWEYGGAVASGNPAHSQALAMELTRTYAWDGPAQRQCLTDLWTLQTGFDYHAVGAGDRRGIPLAPMAQLFGSSWTSSSQATAWLQIPQRQVEWGLLDITRNFGSPCAAWAYWGPAVTATVTGPTTVPAGGATSVDVRYVKLREPVASATLTVQKLVGGAWVDAQQVPVTAGAATLQLSPGSTSTTYRLRNWDGSALSAELTVNVAEVTTTVTGPTTVPAGGSTTLTVGYAKDAQPVPSATVTLQRIADGAWVDDQAITITNGTGSVTLQPATTTTYRVRNWNTSTASVPVTITVAELKARLTGPQAVAPGGTTTVAVTYTKDGAPVAAATVTLQAVVNGGWVDVDTVAVSGGAGTVSLRPAATTEYRFRNWNLTAASVPFTVVVAAAAFSDVAPTHPLRANIEWFAQQGITTGYPDGTFRPSEPVTRDAMAAFLYRLSGRPAFTPPAASPFPDVTTADAFYREIAWLAATGITTGTRQPDGSVRYLPTAPVARDAMAAFLYRMAGSPAFTPPERSPFVDVTPAHPFYKEIAWLHAAGISTGTVRADGTALFEPASPISREAMAAFLNRYATR